MNRTPLPDNIYKALWILLPECEFRWNATDLYNSKGRQLAAMFLETLDKLGLI